MKKQITRIISAALAVTMLCGCQANPDKDVVISKNDGAFDSALLQTAPTAPDDQAQTQRVQVSDTFTSTDGSVQFSLNVDQDIQAQSLSVVEVTPYFFSEADVQRIAQLLLPGADFYERQAEFIPPKFSKSQLQEKIARASQYANEEDLKCLYGDRYNEDIFLTMDDDGADSTPVERFKAEINRYMDMLGTASDEDPRTPCEWSWKLESNYREGPEEAARRSGVGEERQIQANAAANGIEYYLVARKHDGSDYMASMLNLTHWGTLSPWSVDQEIWRHQLLEENYPTQEQIDAAVARAKELLQQVGIGSWEVDSGSVIDWYGEDCPAICVQAGPVLSGTPALWREQTIWYSRSDSGQVYGTAGAELVFSADGVLMSFRIDNPIQEAGVVNSQPSILSIEDMIGRAKENLSLTDIRSFIHEAFLTAMEYQYEQMPELHIDITGLSFGLVRVDVKDAPGTFYYVPAMVLSGSKGLYDPETGECLLRSGDPDSRLGSEEVTPLVGINALDGSIVPLS